MSSSWMFPKKCESSSSTNTTTNSSSYYGNEGGTSDEMLHSRGGDYKATWCGGHKKDSLQSNDPSLYTSVTPTQTNIILRHAMRPTGF